MYACAVGLASISTCSIESAVLVVLLISTLVGSSGGSLDKEDTPKGSGSSGTMETSVSPKGTTGIALDRASLEAIIEGVSQRLASSKETGLLDSRGKAKTPPPSSGREVQEQLVALNLRPSCQTPFLECDMACPAEGWGGGQWRPAAF